MAYSVLYSSTSNCWLNSTMFRSRNSFNRPVWRKKIHSLATLSEPCIEMALGSPRTRPRLMISFNKPATVALQAQGAVKRSRSSDHLTLDCYQTRESAIIPCSPRPLVHPQGILGEAAEELSPASEVS